MDLNTYLGWGWGNEDKKKKETSNLLYSVSPGFRMPSSSP